MIKVFTTFSGYDSQCVALERLGLEYELVGWSEIDKYAIDAHNALFPQYTKRNYGDIRNIDWSQVPDFDLFTYSSPCTDFSIAGLKQGGEKGSGTRSSLLWECERAISEKRPKYLVMENVATLMGGSFIDLLNKWLKTLEGYGYKNFAKLINAKDYGVPQNRLRTIVVSIHQDENTKWHEIMYNFPEPKRTKGKMSDILENEVDRRYYIGMDGKSLEIIPRRNMYEYDNSNVIAMISGKGYGTKFESIRRVYDINALAPTITTYGGGNREAKIMLEDSDGRKSVRKLTERECFRLMGLNDAEIDAIKATGASRTQQYKMAGNSICVNALSAVFDKLFVHTADKEKRLF